jgi:hypothetical protein
MSGLNGVSEIFVFFFLLGFQPVHAGGSSGHDRAPSPVDMFDSGTASPPRSSCRCKEYLLRIADLEGRLSLMKCQAKLAMDKASKSCGFMKQISVLEDKVSGLMAKIVHLEECDSFLIGIVEFVCEMLRCEVPCCLSCFLLFHCCCLIFFLSQVLVWTLLLKHVGFLSELQLWRKHQRESTVCGLIPDTVVPLCYFKIVLSILERQLMVVEDI